jgi:hypothetical protein
MNKYMKLIGVGVLVGIVVLVGAAVAFAQNPTPIPPAGGYGTGYGPGMMGGAGGHGHLGGHGFMAEYQGVMHTKIAGALGMTVDDFNAALAAGKTPFTIAQEKGIDFTTVQAAMQAAHAEVLKQAVADGKLTQAQADAMLNHQAQVQTWHANGGSHMGRGQGMMGGRGSFNGACPFANATPAP